MRVDKYIWPNKKKDRKQVIKDMQQMQVVNHPGRPRASEFEVFGKENG